MSVDTLRENFHINRISVKDLQDFLTAQTYRPEITDVKHKILALNHVSLQSVCSKPIRQGKSPKYTENTGLICIKPRNTNSMLVSAEEVDWIEPSTKAEIQNQKLVYGDVVITRSGSGTIGRASVYPYAEEAYVNDHLFIVRPSSADSHYVCSYLKSYFGERLLESGISGSTGQLNLSNEHIKAVPLFFPKPDAQKYIGEKVRQAERLRSWAKQLKANVNSVLDDLVLPIHAKPDMFSYAKKSILGDRLDPRPYRSNVVDLVDSIESLDHDKISTLVTFSSGCPVSSNDFVEESFAIPLVRIRNIAEEGFKGLDTGITQHTYDEAANYHAKEGMIVLGMDGYFKAQFCIPEELPMLINQRVAMLAVNGIRAELLTHWLNRPEGQLQLNQWAVKTTVEHTSLTDLAKVLIPRLNDSLEDELANKLSNARYSIRLSYKLTNLAKHLVENLIEGIVSEAEIVSAQQALEAGDESLDRALLERMTASGIDGEGDPLFDDIDQLYDLLDQAKQALDADNSMAEV